MTIEKEDARLYSAINFRAIISAPRAIRRRIIDLMLAYDVEDTRGYDFLDAIYYLNSL